MKSVTCTPRTVIILSYEGTPDPLQAYSRSSKINHITNKIGKVYSVEYNDIPKVFFTPDHEVIAALM
jgi:hypothetical protein